MHITHLFLLEIIYSLSLWLSKLPRYLFHQHSHFIIFLTIYYAYKYSYKKIPKSTYYIKINTLKWYKKCKILLKKQHKNFQKFFSIFIFYRIKDNLSLFLFSHKIQKDQLFAGLNEKNGIVTTVLCSLMAHTLAIFCSLGYCSSPQKYKYILGTPNTDIADIIFINIRFQSYKTKRPAIRWS